MFNILNIIKENRISVLRPNCWSLRIMGLVERKGILSIFFYYFCLFGMFCFVPSQFMELWHLRNDQDQALKNLSYSLLSFTCYVKGGSFLLWKKHWKKVLNYVSDTELNLKTEKNRKIENITKVYIRYSQTVTYLYWGLAFFTAIMLTVSPLLIGFVPTQSRQRILSAVDPYPEIMSSWVPFDKSRGVGYCATFLLQATTFISGAGLCGCYDSTVFALMTFFTGQFKVLKIQCEEIFKIGTKESALERIRDCYKRHENLVKHCKILNSVLSPVMFLYVIVCSIMIFAAATKLTSESAGVMQKIWFGEYILALIFQLFLYCWHSTEVYYSSQGLEYAVFSSTWYQADCQLRQNILLLNGKLRNSIIFRAGPFTILDVTTFIAILKGSYSYYAILK